MRLRKYSTCIKDLEKQGLTRRQIADLIGIDEAVISRRMRQPKPGEKPSKPTVEALIVINTLADVFSQEFFDAKQVEFKSTGWLNQKILQANDLHALGKVA